MEIGSSFPLISFFWTWFSAAKASADIKKKKEKQDDDGNGNAVPNAEVLLGSSLGRVIENGNTNPEFPSGKVVRVSTLFLHRV